MQHAKDARRRLRHNIAREAAECVRPRAAGIDQRCYAGAHARNTGVDAVLIHAFIHMRMQVDHARRHDAAANIDNPPRRIRADVGRNCRYDAARRRDIQLRPDILRRVYNLAALEQQIRHSETSKL